MRTLGISGTCPCGIYGHNGHRNTRDDSGHTVFDLEVDEIAGIIGVLRRFGT